MSEEQNELTQETIPEYLTSDNNGEARPSMLLQMIMSHSARRVLDRPAEDLGLAEHLPYPFMALVGQIEMRTALLLGVINPNIGGVLLIGPRGIGKTTAARGLSHLLPHIHQSTCVYGCMPDDYKTEGAFGVCDDCASKLEAGESITRMAPVRLVELPLNSRLEDVVGGVNERIAIQTNTIRVDKGILARADQNLLYIDEVNLLPDEIIDAILDAAAQGIYTVHRGAIRATYRSRFMLIGSMNPEEGNLRPQILDRFGLRVMVTGTSNTDERMRIYERVRDFRSSPRAFIQAYGEETDLAFQDILYARELLPDVKIAAQAQALGMQLVNKLNIHSHRAEFTMFEAARAYTAADGRTEVTVDDITAVASMALRMRRSDYIDEFINSQKDEDDRITGLIEELKGS